MASLWEYLEPLVKGSANQTAMAARIGISQSRISKLKQGGSLSVTHCLTLAKRLRRPPREVFVAAGKADVADLIEQLYGPAMLAEPVEIDEDTIKLVERAQLELQTFAESFGVIARSVARSAQVPPVRRTRKQSRTRRNGE